MNWVRVSGLKLKLKQGGMQEIHKNCTFLIHEKTNEAHNYSSILDERYS